ncbi:MAG: conserved repeat domain protein [Schlesneria sp.]|nr:conserved repeat domain protein [Schlesneria sp.]
MRRGTWILAISGVMALNNGVSFAADPSLGVPPGGQRPLILRGRQAIPPSAGLPSKYVRDASAADKLAADKADKDADKAVAQKPAADKATAKNYYDELFTEQAPKSQPSAASTVWEAESPEAPAAAATAPAKAPLTKTASAGFDAVPAADARKFAPGARGARPIPSATENKVIQAGYDRLPPEAERKMIQQARSESAPKRSTAPPMPELGGSANTPAAPTAPVAPVTKTAARTVGATASPAAVDNSPQTPQITIEWTKKGEINVGQECLLELHVKNTGSVPTTQVAIDGQFAGTVRLTSAEPKPVASGDKVTWSFDSMAPGAEHKILIKLIPSRRGDLGATAQVRFTGTASASFQVEEPMLKVALKGPAEVTLGDPAPQMIIVSNPGTGTAHNVKVEARLSDGLEHRSPGERLIMEVGSLSPGETRSVRLPLSAIKGGQQSIGVTATSSSDASATTSAQLNVIAPSMKIAIDGPALRYKGRNAKYTLTVTNDGSVANNNVRIAHAVPEGFKFVSADHSGKFETSIKNVQWFVGRLEPGQNVQVSCDLSPVAMGDFSHTVSVLSDSGVRAEAKTQTRVDGTASLTMTLVDLDDPVEIGAETAYEIRVKNEGSKAATGVTIACELPPEMELKNFKAPVNAIVEGRQILFKSLEQIAPGGEAVYRVHVKGVQEGNHRMRVRMTAASLQEPVVREEATKVYADQK